VFVHGVAFEETSCQVAAAVESGPNVEVLLANCARFSWIPTVEGIPSRRCRARADAVDIHGFFHAVAKDVVLVIGFQLQHGGAVGVGVFGEFLGRNKMVPVIVTVLPRRAVGDQDLLRQVAFGVVRVVVDAIGRETVAGRGGVAAVVAVAGGVVGDGSCAVGGDLVGVVVGVGDGRAVVLRGEAAGGVVGEGQARQRGIGAVLAEDVCNGAGVVIGVGGAGDGEGAGDIAETRDVLDLAALVVGEVDAQGGDAVGEIAAGELTLVVVHGSRYAASGVSDLRALATSVVGEGQQVSPHVGNGRDLALGVVGERVRAVGIGCG